MRSRVTSSEALRKGAENIPLKSLYEGECGYEKNT